MPDEEAEEAADDLDFIKKAFTGTDADLRAHLEWAVENIPRGSLKTAISMTLSAPGAHNGPSGFAARVGPMPAGPDGYVGSHQFPGGSQAKGKEVKEKNKVPLQAKKLARAIARGFQARHHLGKVQYDAVVVIMAKAAKEMHGRVSTNNRSAASGPRSMGRVGLTPHARELLATDPVIVSAMSGPNPLMKAGKKHVPFSEADKRGEMTSQHELFLFEWDAYAAGDFESFCWYVCNLLGQNGRRTVGEVSKCGGLWWVVWVQWWVVWCDEWVSVVWCGVDGQV